MGRFGAFVLTLVAGGAIVVAGGLVYVYSGSYNIAASAGHSALVRWLLRTTKERSIRTHAQTVLAAPKLSEERARRGLEHFDETCVQCHGAPGVERGELGKGITPQPPDLAKAVRRWNERELFWIVKNGIKLAGMPAFGATHSDAELWSMVAFLERLPDISPQEYRRATRGAPASPAATR